MERFDIVDMVRNYLKSAELLAQKKDVTVRFDDYDPIFVWGDEFKIEEVLQNYYSNALNHIDGEKVIEVKLQKKDNHVRVSVFNTGKPIPEESIGHIWDKFYKVDKARTREYGGSGVGLSIVRAIMEGMHQAYGVNNYDNGVEFYFELETK
jgi:signal transduction histidine kinase